MNDWYSAEVLSRHQEDRVAKKAMQIWRFEHVLQKHREHHLSLFGRGIRLIRRKAGREGRSLSP
ncbi:hypothetical protein [Alicyclobacillus sp. SO9]|uniref:hypothetical protein n=1 Tax=Alicyclobacillus sp. SO9 TaxID=2665646 RepID=UPI0018E806A0|nr:hypothetical protein [Alicyclobacillus sp. SO9]QQE78212.1 hypothetical protein GI364_20365 [Alicyclobacillus sp. SO9]